MYKSYNTVHTVYSIVCSKNMCNNNNGMYVLKVCTDITQYSYSIVYDPMGEREDNKMPGL